MKKRISLLILIVIASCGPLVENGGSSPYVVVGHTYIYYNRYGSSPGVVRCDTVQVVDFADRCVYYKHRGSYYIMDKSRFKCCTDPIKKPTK
jgi:hypothetical protein